MSDRVAFLRRTYTVLGFALLAWAVLTAGMMRFATETSLAFSQWALAGGRWNWLIVLGLFMLVGYGAQRLALSNASRGTQYVGLAVFIVAESLILQPLLWLVIARFGGGADAFALIGQAAVITIAIFIGLTATVFITKRDFSFLRGVLTVGMFAAMGLIVASIVFGFSLGAVFCGAVILLMAGYILFQTTIILKEFPPTYHVAAALMLFSTIATLFWYVLQLLMAIRRD